MFKRYFIAPEGYVPFHLEHYGRHGSRWHIGGYTYDAPYRLLPIKSELAPYYKWEDVRKYYLQKLNN